MIYGTKSRTVVVHKFETAMNNKHEEQKWQWCFEKQHSGKATLDKAHHQLSMLNLLTAGAIM